ncbi:MAG TPA: TIGR04086 family membrane protein [Clostridiaceae bacterium]
MNRNNLIYIGEGVLRSIILAFALVFIYSVLTLFITLSSGVTSMVLLVTSMLSVVYGTIFSAKKIGSKGWLVGIAVSLLYMVVLYLVSVISKESTPFSQEHIFRFSLALVVGSLAGMLGRNV